MAGELNESAASRCECGAGLAPPSPWQKPSALRDPSIFFARTIPEPNTGCLLWTGDANDDGYGRIKSHGRYHLAHRVAWRMAFGGIPEGLLICHRCDTPARVNADHLFLGTGDDNMRDMARKGRSRVFYGPANPRARLTWEIIRAIRAEAAAGASYQCLAERFGIGYGHVWKIIHNERWTVPSSGPAHV